MITKFNERIVKAVLLFVCCVLSALPTYAGDPPNFVIFIADDVSWNDMGYAGNPDVQTPTIDRIAAEGINFTHTYLTASSCSPSRNSIFAGRYPHNTGAAELHTEPPMDMLSFPQVLKEQGYYNAFSGKFHGHNFLRPYFDVLSIDYPVIGNSGSDDWVNVMRNRPQDQPFFMWFAALDAHRDWGENAYSGTHDPETLEVPFYMADAEGTRKDLAQYYDEIHRFDRRIQEVMDVLQEQDALENTLIIIMADNGRPFPHSKTRVNDRGMRTPFVVYWPKTITQPGAVSTSLISAIDIAPTILTLAGVDNMDPSFQGKSFDELLKEPHQPFRNFVFAEHNWHDYEAHERMVRDSDFLYIVNSRPNLPNIGPCDSVSSPSHADLKRLVAKGNLSPAQADIFVTPRPREELYDCTDDPLQLLNVAAVPEYAQNLERMRAVLQTWIEATGDSTPANLTRDWYLREPHYKNTQYDQLRGEMPGAEHNATKTMNSGPF